MDNLELKKEEASKWFKSLRDQFCKAFEEIDGGKFLKKQWNHKGEGGGEMRQTDVSLQHKSTIPFIKEWSLIPLHTSLYFPLGLSYQRVHKRGPSHLTKLE